MLNSKLLLLLMVLMAFGCTRKEFFQESALVEPVSSLNNARYDSALVVAGRHYKRGAWHRFWWGRHYRAVWAQPVTLPVLDLATMHGGLTSEKLGGGFQSTSLTLENEEGKSFALRSVDKDPNGVLPKAFRKDFLVNVLRDQTSAAHPYGAVVVAALASEAKIPQSHPIFVYIPKSPKGLEENTEAFEERVFLMEEKFEGKEDLTTSFGKAIDFVDSEVFLRNRFTQHGHLANQKAFAKARLFDILIGDWDRHEGQWQWAVQESSPVTTYSPVPKDRDQAFFKFDDGVVPWLFTRRWAPLSKMKTFHHQIKSVRGYLENSAFLDDRTLNEVTEAEWKKQALELQKLLTDQVLETSVAALPPAVYPLSAPELLAKLKARRDQLPDVAQQVYRQLAKHTLVPGTDAEEIFEVERQQNGNTLVRVYQKSSDENQPPLLVFERLFIYGHTKSISLYGLGQEDEFKISGKGEKGMLLNIYGGMGEDELTDTSFVKGWARKTRVYDTKRGIEIVKGKETRLKLSKSVEVHAFDREGL